MKSMNRLCTLAFAAMVACAVCAMPSAAAATKRDAFVDQDRNGKVDSADLLAVRQTYYDGNGDGVVNAIDLTYMKREQLQAQTETADYCLAAQHFLLGKNEQLKPVLPLVYCMNVPGMSPFNPEDIVNVGLPTMMDRMEMDVVVSQEELERFYREGKQYDVYGDGFPDSVAFLVTSVEPSVETQITFDKMVRKDGKIFLTATRHTPEDAEQAPALFQLHAQIPAEQYHGEPVELFIRDEVPLTVGDKFTLCESFHLGEQFLDEPPQSTTMQTIRTVEEFRTLLASCANPLPDAERLDEAFFAGHQLLVLSIAGKKTSETYHTTSVTIADGVAHWQTVRVGNILSSGFPVTAYLAVVVPAQVGDVVQTLDCSTQYVQFW